MPRITTNSLIQKAIYPAVCDREAMIEADPARAEEIRVEIAEIESLAGIKLSKMTDAQRNAARMALTYAEQWESSLADALGTKNEYGRKALQLSILFRTHRHMTFGKNAFEANMDASEPYFLGADRKFRNKDGKELVFRKYPGSI